MIYLLFILSILVFVLSVYIFLINKKVKNKTQELYQILDKVPQCIIIHDDSNVYYISSKAKMVFDDNIKTNHDVLKLLQKERIFELMKKLKGKEYIYENNLR
ncbi:hypothetical protein SAMN02745164_00880 [Marinitoga hydrogenitolerans DSM 16785]|uniref:PAS domain-containing protein n=1 Tax=Marinitoga hydrogenitolerans (strain DSM 16785 / JCM 12826 / AT1271) TaxID=1122195 RepID=A0A1M4VA55_MARH1|nr:hypothetical protein [Marinitoga hydrogenitolerans]SHE65757.1 hypothetical protein SAMN02745164_00880 [Marinitoga hydrogenitolerans DSM 16785]